MSSAEFRAALKSNFPPLKDYYDDLKGRCKVLEVNENINFDAFIAERIEQWMLKRRRNVFKSMPKNNRPVYIFDQFRYKYHTAVDINCKEVIQACDANGVAVHSREQTIWHLSDTAMIARIDTPRFRSVLKAQFVLDNPDAD